jgi:hypothetical protein
MPRDAVRSFCSSGTDAMAAGCFLLEKAAALYVSGYPRRRGCAIATEPFAGGSRPRDSSLRTRG